jgi:pimeloyl-ACP methyl ester carboxylesterase
MSLKRVNKRAGIFAVGLLAIMLLTAAGRGESAKISPDVNKSMPDSNSLITKKFIDIGQIYTYFEIAGAGTPVILIHGHSVDCRMWDPQIAELAKHYKVIRYDLRGYGKTDVPVEGEKFSHAEDLHKLMWFLGVQRAHIVGLSLGAAVAADFLAMYPEEALSVTAIAGGIWPLAIPEDANNAQKAKIEAEIRQKKLESIETVKKQGIEAYKKQWLEFVLSACGPHKNEIKPKLQQMIDEWSAWQALHVEPLRDINPPVTIQLKTKKPDVPVLIVTGKDDLQNSINAGKALAEILPNARTVYIENAGHFPNMETPAEFNKILLDFLSSVK